MVRLGPIKELCTIGEAEEYIVRSQKIGEKEEVIAKIFFSCVVRTCLDMPRHIIIAFHGMPKGSISIPLGRDYSNCIMVLFDEANRHR